MCFSKNLYYFLSGLVFRPYFLNLDNEITHTILFLYKVVTILFRESLNMKDIDYHSISLCHITKRVIVKTWILIKSVSFLFLILALNT